jgi:hypothetical protein
MANIIVNIRGVKALPPRGQIARTGVEEFGSHGCGWFEQKETEETENSISASVISVFSCGE